MTEDKIEKKWISKEGFECWIRHFKTHRCGYVKVSKDNLTNEIDDYNDIPVEIHGGLTWGSKGSWGFDCMHWNDTLDVWTLKRVEEEVNNLSEQLAKITWRDVINHKLEFLPIWFKKKFEEKELGGTQ